MSFIVKLFRVIRSQIAKNRPRVAVVFGLVGKKHRIDRHGVKVIVSLPLSAHHVVQVGIVITARIHRNVAGGVNLVVNVHKQVAAVGTVVVLLRHRIRPSDLIFAFGGGIATLLRPTVGLVLTIAVTP